MNEQLGRLITGEAVKDAIHIAIAPVEAGEWIYPGSAIGVKNGVAFVHLRRKVGIADPFLTERIAKGAKFWIMLYPNTITSLRHEWTHPDFGETSEEWLRAYCAKNRLDYDSLVGDEHFVGDNESFNDYISDEFKRHYRAVTGCGEELPYFRCAC